MKTPFIAAVTVALMFTSTVLAAPAVAAAKAPTASATVPDSTVVPRTDVTSNGRVWKQTYRQGFDSINAPLGTFTKKYPQMATYNGFSDTSGQGLYAPDKVLSVANGALDFALHSEKGQPLVAAVMPDGYAPHKTGRVSIRYKTTKTTGYKFVGMLWPSSDNWNEGEIDWPEADLGAKARPASAIPGSYSRGMMKFEPAQEKFTASDTTGWHVATTEWDKGIVRFYWDGRLVATSTKAVPTTAFRVTLQAETSLAGLTPTNAVGHVDIDWISIWK